MAGPAQATNGDFYGSTFVGGANASGSLFKMTPAGVLSTIYSFCPQLNCTGDGTGGGAQLIQTVDGYLYGLAFMGGTNNGGTVFKITPAGALTTVYNFCSLPDCADGNFPVGALVQTSDGNLYGVTSNGGSRRTCIAGCGTVFRITPAGALTTIYNFCSQALCADGAIPQWGLNLGSDGNFYGTTFNRGIINSHCTSGCGTVFKLTPAGVLTTLYTFCSQPNCADGAQARTGVVRAANGYLDGTTSSGGTNCVPYGCGLIFTLSPGGVFTTLHSFCGPHAGADGAIRTLG